jgi:hypothetical protein
MDDLDRLTTEIVKSRETFLARLDRALELVQAHYRKLESKPSLNPKPNSTPEV